MGKFWAVSLLTFLFPWSLIQDPPPAPAGERPVMLLELKGVIDDVAEAMVNRAIKEARAKGARALLVEMDTPGGAITNMEKIIDALSGDEDFETICFINSNAISAGALIAVACEKIYMVPGAMIGDALPVRLLPGVGIAPVSEDPDVKEKMISVIRERFRDLALRRGRNPDIAEAMVDPKVELQRVRIDGEIRIMAIEEVELLMQQGKKLDLMDSGPIVKRGELLTLSAQRALNLDFINGMAESRTQVLDILALSDHPLVEVKMTATEETAIQLRQLAPLLFILGCLFAYMEFKLPGFGIPGILSLVCFILLFASNFIVGLGDYLPIVFFLLGAALIAVEIFLIPGTVVSALVGAGLILYGIFMSFTGFAWPDNAVDFQIMEQTAQTLLLSFLVIGVLAVLISTILSRYLTYIPFIGKRMAMLGQEMDASAQKVSRGPLDDTSLMGKEGLARTDLRPAGKIEVEGKVLDAQSRGPFISRGEAIRVVEVGESRIMVARKPAE